MDCKIRLAATLLDRGFLNQEPEIKGEFCHAHAAFHDIHEDISSTCYQGKVFDIHQSWLICDQCIKKVKSCPREKMYLEDESLKQELALDSIIEKRMLTDYI